MVRGKIIRANFVDSHQEWDVEVERNGISEIKYIYQENDGRVLMPPHIELVKVSGKNVIIFHPHIVSLTYQADNE